MLTLIEAISLPTNKITEYQHIKKQTQNNHTLHQEQNQTTRNTAPVLKHYETFTKNIEEEEDIPFA